MNTEIQEAYRKTCKALAKIQNLKNRVWWGTERADHDSELNSSIAEYNKLANNEIKIRCKNW